MDRYQKLFSKLNISFKEQNLVDQVFTHRSYLNEAKKQLSSNERLEFLGDSILSFLVSEYLYNNYPELPEGELTNLRSSIVKTKTLALAAEELDLGNYLFLSKGEEEGDGRKNHSLLADTFEALLGAVYLSSGLNNVKSIITSFLLPKLTKIIEEKEYKDAKSSFQELVQDIYRVSPNYKVLEETGPDHSKQFTVGVYVNDTLFGKGQGKSKQEAEQVAAHVALEKCNRK